MANSYRTSEVEQGQGIPAGMPDAAMGRARAFLFTLIILALAVHLVWIAIAPLIPYTIGAVAAVGVLGALYYRKSRW